MSFADLKYVDVIHECLAGDEVSTRNSVCFRALCCRARFVSAPLVGVRKTAWKNALREWQWFMSGSADILDLHESVRHWWRPWATENGYIPFNYSVQFRDAIGAAGRRTDQIANLIDGIRNHPGSRRLVITTWNAAEMWSPDCPITNCHNTVTQCFVGADGALNMKTYQRSADVVCGLPHNWIQQWAFLMWLAHRSGRRVGWLEWEGGDCHVYKAHNDLTVRILRAAQNQRPPVPRLVYAPTSDEFLADDFSLDGPYEPVITERAEMIV